MVKIRRIQGTPYVKDIFYEEDAMMGGEDDDAEGVAQHNVDNDGGTVDKEMQSVDDETGE